MTQISLLLGGGRGGLLKKVIFKENLTKTVSTLTHPNPSEEGIFVVFSFSLNRTQVN